MRRWITSVLAQNVTAIPAQAVPSQNSMPLTSGFPLARTSPLNSTAPPAYGRAAAITLTGSRLFQP
jgi:hypothetical protein